MDSISLPGRSENPALNSQTFKQFANVNYREAMTVRGTVNKIAILLSLVTASAALAWLSISHIGDFETVYPWMVGSGVAALIVAIITCVNKPAARLTAPLYAVLEGIVLGFTSAIFEAEYPGLAIQAVFLTFGTLLGLLVVYRVSGFHVTARFQAGVASATLAIFLVYLANICLQLLGMQGIPFIHQNNLIGIGLSLFVVGIAALNLILDFDLIETGARERAPLYMEWYAAFGLMVSLIWLYLEVLKLLIQIAAASDDD